MKHWPFILLALSISFAQEKETSNPGIGTNYPGDTEIGSHPAVIFAENFEGKEDFRNRWDEVRDKDGAVLKRVDPEDGKQRLGKNCMEVTATLGENTGGGITRWFKSSPTIYIRFYTKFHPQCDYIHHFVTLRANKSLRGGDR